MLSVKSVIKGCGHYLPKRIVENKYFENTLDTTDQWIYSRTGIKKRHFASKNELTSDLAINAAKKALLDAKIHPETIDVLILATTTPDQTFPSTATKVQHGIGMSKGYAFDIQAVCAGFIFALNNANALIKSGQAKRVLVIGAETFSRILNWEDRSTCVLFGDGAGAVVLEAEEKKENSRGLLSCTLFSNGKYNDLLYVSGGVSSTKNSGHVIMQGKEVFKHAVSKLVEASEKTLKNAKISKNEISWIVPHQANIRIINSTAKKLKIDPSKIILTVDIHGNTSAASIPLALSTAKLENKFKINDIILLEAIGGGLAWGAMVLRW